MAYSAYLELTNPKVSGEATASGFEKQIELIGWNFGLANGVHRDAGSKLQQGSVNVDAITVRKASDSATPALMGMCATGKVGSKTKAVITIAISGKKPQPRLIITMDSAIVSRVTVNSLGDGEDARLVDTFTLHFSSVKFEYQNYNSEGTPTTKPAFLYDLETKTVTPPA